MFTVKKVERNYGLIRMGLGWMVEFRDFSGEARSFGYFSSRTRAAKAAQALNATATVEAA